VKHFHRITGKFRSIEGLKDSVNIEEGHAELQYEIDGVKRTLQPVVENDWADAKVVETIMSDLCQPGYDYYPKDNGQASVWFYLTEQQAVALNTLANNVFNINRKPWWKVW